MFSVEILAWIVAVVIVVKFLVIFVKPKTWASVIDFVYAKPWLLTIVSLILAYLVLQSLLDSGITIVQIFAVLLFLSLLAASTASVYSKDVTALGKKLLKDRNILKKAWLPILVWIALTVWAIAELI